MKEEDAKYPFLSKRENSNSYNIKYPWQNSLPDHVHKYRETSEQQLRAHDVGHQDHDRADDNCLRRVTAYLQGAAIDRVAEIAGDRGDDETEDH